MRSHARVGDLETQERRTYAHGGHRPKLVTRHVFGVITVNVGMTAEPTFKHASLRPLRVLSFVTIGRKSSKEGTTTTGCPTIVSVSFFGVVTSSDRGIRCRTYIADNVANSLLPTSIFLRQVSLSHANQNLTFLVVPFIDT